MNNMNFSCVYARGGAYTRALAVQRHLHTERAPAAASLHAVLLVRVHLRAKHEGDVPTHTGLHMSNGGHTGLHMSNGALMWEIIRASRARSAAHMSNGPHGKCICASRGAPHRVRDRVQILPVHVAALLRLLIKRLLRRILLIAIARLRRIRDMHISNEGMGKND